MGWRESGVVCYHTPCAFCSGVAWACRIYYIVESESDPLTRWPVDFFEKEALKGKWEVHLHTPTKFGEDRPKDLGGDREHTNKHSHKRCSNYSMIIKIYKQIIVIWQKKVIEFWKIHVRLLRYERLKCECRPIVPRVRFGLFWVGHACSTNYCERVLQPQYKREWQMTLE